MHVLVLHPQATVRHRVRETLRHIQLLLRNLRLDLLVPRDLDLLPDLFDFLMILKVINLPPQAEPTYPAAAGAGQILACRETLVC